MPVVLANGIEIAYDDRGSRTDPAILLIMGLGTQMIAWPEAFCDDLAIRGFRVIRFDNRDVGLSTKFDAPSLDLGAVLQRVMAGEKINPPYDLTDMAADTVGLMDRLAIKKAHIVGASMGGMIAQIVGDARSHDGDHASASRRQRPRVSGPARHENLQSDRQSGFSDAGRRIKN